MKKLRLLSIVLLLAILVSCTPVTPDGGETTTDAPTTEAPVGEGTTTEPITGDPSTGDPSTGDPSTGEPSTGEPEPPAGPIEESYQFSEINFSAVKPYQFTSSDTIVIPASAVDACTCTSKLYEKTAGSRYHFWPADCNGVCDCPACASGVVKLKVSGLFHYYFAASDINDTAGSNLAKTDPFLKYTIEIPEDGTYRVGFFFRLKDTAARGAIFELDDTHIYRVSYSLQSVTGLQDTSNDGSYMTGLYWELEAGKHTLIIRPLDASTGSLHFREFYFDKLDSSELEELELAKENNSSAVNVTWLQGYVGSSTNVQGNINTVYTGATDYVHTDVFTVAKAGTTVWFIDHKANFASTSAYVFSSWKKVDGAWVIDLDGTNIPGNKANPNDNIIPTANGGVLYTYTTKADNENLRLCYQCKDQPSRPTVYIASKDGTGIKPVDQLAEWIEQMKNGNEYYKNLEGLTVSAIGDSYFQGDSLSTEFVWLNLMRRVYAGMTLNNYGQNGTTVANYNSNSMVNRYTQMFNAKDPNIVLIEGGRNDYNKGILVGDVNSTNKDTFCGALNVMIDGIQAKYGENVMIVLISPWNFTGSKTVTDNGVSVTYTYKNYVDGMKAVAEAQGVYFIDASNPETVGVDMTSSEFKSKYSINGSSISHLNLEGMKYVMPKFTKILSEYYADFIANK